MHGGSWSWHGEGDGGWNQWQWSSGEWSGGCWHAHDASSAAAVADSAPAWHGGGGWADGGVDGAPNLPGGVAIAPNLPAPDGALTLQAAVADANVGPSQWVPEIQHPAGMDFSFPDERKTNPWRWQDLVAQLTLGDMQRVVCGEDRSRGLVGCRLVRADQYDHKRSHARLQTTGENDGPMCGISFWTARMGHAYRCTQILKARRSRCEKVCNCQTRKCRKVARERQKARAPTSITNTSMSRKRCVLTPTEGWPKEAARGAARDGPTVARRLHGHPQSRNEGTTAVAASAMELVSWPFLVFFGGDVICFVRRRIAPCAFVHVFGGAAAAA